MGFGKKLKNVAKRALILGHMSRKQFKSIRSKLGLTSKNKFARQLRRSLPAASLASPVSTSAYTEGYHADPRTLSQLTGGV